MDSLLLSNQLLYTVYQIRVKAGFTHGQITSSPGRWAFVGLVPHLRTHQQCSKGILSPSLRPEHVLSILGLKPRTLCFWAQFQTCWATKHFNSAAFDTERALRVFEFDASAFIVPQYFTHYSVLFTHLYHLTTLWSAMVILNVLSK